MKTTPNAPREPWPDESRPSRSVRVLALLAITIVLFNVAMIALTIYFRITA